MQAMCGKVSRSRRLEWESDSSQPPASPSSAHMYIASRLLPPASYPSHAYTHHMQEVRRAQWLVCKTNAATNSSSIICKHLDCYSTAPPASYPFNPYPHHTQEVSSAQWSVCDTNTATNSSFIF